MEWMAESLIAIVSVSDTDEITGVYSCNQNRDISLERLRELETQYPDSDFLIVSAREATTGLAEYVHCCASAIDDFAPDDDPEDVANQILTLGYAIECMSLVLAGHQPSEAMRTAAQQTGLG
jgi:hypothetical protein